MQRKINLLLLSFSLLGGGAAFLAGEYVLGRWLGELPSILLIGIYFGLVGLGVLLGALLAEMISPRLNGISWKQRYLGLSWKLLPLAVALMVGMGALTEFLYELNFGGIKPVRNIVFVIDESGSMLQSDQQGLRRTAAQELVSQMDKDNRVALVSFSDTAAVAQGLTPLKNENDRAAVIAAIGGLEVTTGGTDISAAMREALGVIDTGGGTDSGAMVILLSDGVSQFDTATELVPYTSRGIVVNTIGLALTDSGGTQLLQDIALTTGGQYYDVADAERLGDVFRQIYDRLGDRTLVTERTDNTQASPYYAGLRMLSLLLIGGMLGLGLGIVFDNRHLARSFGLGGIVSGLAAGAVLEFGLNGNGFRDALIRLLAVLLLAGIISLFTGIVPVGEGRLTRSRDRRTGTGPSSSQGVGTPRRNRTSRGF